MPMDTTDYDRIQDIVDKAFKRLEGQVGTMMPKDESLTRHLAASDRITQVESRVASMAQSLTETIKWSMMEHEKIRESSSSRIDKLENTLDVRLKGVETSIDSVKTSISEGRATTLRTIIGYIVSFIIGGGALGIFEFIRSLR